MEINLGPAWSCSLCGETGWDEMLGALKMIERLQTAIVSVMGRYCSSHNEVFLD